VRACHEAISPTFAHSLRDGGVAAVIRGSLVAAGEDVVGVVDTSVASA